MTLSRDRQIMSIRHLLCPEDGPLDEDDIDVVEAYFTVLTDCPPVQSVVRSRYLA